MIDIQRARLFAYSIYYTRPQQLLARLFLLLKRKVLVLTATEKLKKRVAFSTGDYLSLNDNPPTGIFDLRRNSVVHANPLTLNFLNMERSFIGQYDWRPAELKKGTRLWLLNLHYMEFLEGLNEDQSLRTIEYWIDSNLPYDDGYWLDNWNSYALSIRVVVWMQRLPSLRETADNGQWVSIHRSLHAQVKFLFGNLELDIGGNHLIKNIKALLWAGKYFNNKDSECWVRKAEQLLRAQLDEQVLEDGMHYELSPAYHAQVMADLMECNAVLDDSPLKTKLGEKLALMAQVLIDLTHPDGQISLFNDAALHMAYAPEQILSKYELAFGDRPSRRSVFELEDSGYCATFSNGHYLLFDAGPLAPDFLPAHGHGDALAFEYSVGDQRVMIDPGVYCYDAGDDRDFSRSSKSHNTVTLDDLDQSEFWASFRVGRRARIIKRDISASFNSFSVTASHSGYAHLQGSPVHERCVSLVGQQLVIRDDIHNGAQQTAVARFMLHPSFSTEYLGEDSRQVRVWNSDLEFEITSDHPIQVNTSKCFMDFGHVTETIQLSVLIGHGPCSSEVRIECVSTEPH
ncbi:MAG: hypothetical protein NPIRA05_00130 [Nitrospirales bacterium]|nr:MAG: hypothetical protein NPIRA05_00130 [Nitrospirales bacterium]